ncbi:three-helix bundle dimerization domain-containing protein [Rhodococcus sp. NPDC059968]|uniref:three-helix bundle dimerization domain-containing protein n=1 Tax=Rhodococcus sp. NPDC059968 TaxID=3347017 RepID=UPI00366E129F
MNSAEEARQISQVATRLRNKFPVASQKAVGTAVEAAVAHVAGCPICDFVPLLVERTATAKLGSLLAA